MSDSIIDHLKSSKNGIVCLTPENLESAWLHFEAGALAFESMFQRKTFNEPVHHCTDQAWLQRCQGARTTHERLSGSPAESQGLCACASAAACDSFQERKSAHVER